MKSQYLKYIYTVLLIGIGQFTYGQCSMCRAVVESDISGKGSGINNGIVYLMAFPYTLIVIIAFGLVYKMRKDAKQ